MAVQESNGTKVIVSRRGFYIFLWKWEC